jgi:transcriptional regulator with XRE-family HTH domain
MIEKDLRAVLSMNLKRYRNRRKFTQAEFAEKVNISIPFLSDIENGKKWVSPATLVKMATVLKIDAYELLKPEKILPDNTVDIIESYTFDIYAAFEKTLENLSADYLDKLSKN